MDNRPKIYLAGLISVDYPQSLEWRERVQPTLEGWGFEVISPMRGIKNLKNETIDGGITSSAITSKSIVLRDRRDVLESDVILMHLENFGSPRPLIGTMCEAAWAYDQRTPVVAIARADNYLMRNHPFLVEFISRYEEDEERALIFIKQYYCRRSEI